MTVFLHIGSPKTGTTAIQYFCGANRELLLKNGVFYPDSAQFMQKLGYNPNRNALWLHLGFNTPEFQGYLEKLAGYCKEHDKVVLSDEALYLHYQQDREIFRQLKSYLDAQGIDLKIIVYLRRQDEYLYSLWAQDVKESYEWDFDTWLSDGGERVFMDYYRYLERLSEDIGKENIVLRIYERKRFPDGSIIADFLDIVGLEYTDKYVIPRQSNPSLRSVFLETKRRLNHYPEFRQIKEGADKDPDQFKTAAAYRNILLDVQADDDGHWDNPLMLPGETRKQILGKYDEGNRKVAEEYLGESAGTPLFEEVLDINVPEIPAESVDADCFHIMALMVMKSYENSLELRKQYDTLKDEYKQLKEQTRLKNLPSFVVHRLGEHLRGRKN